MKRSNHTLGPPVSFCNALRFRTHCKLCNSSHSSTSYLQDILDLVQEYPPTPGICSHSCWVQTYWCIAHKCMPPPNTCRCQDKDLQKVFPSLCPSHAVSQPHISRSWSDQSTASVRLGSLSPVSPHRVHTSAEISPRCRLMDFAGRRRHRGCEYGIPPHT